MSETCANQACFLQAVHEVKITNKHTDYMILLMPASDTIPQTMISTVKTTKQRQPQPG